MKKITLLIFAVSLVIQTTNAQVEKLSGPRFGFTYITDGSLMYNINDLPNEYNVLRIQTEVDKDYKGHIRIMHWTGNKGKKIIDSKKWD